ncbi:MAG: peptidoglycan bridge formation glycyltransferase FemA/FemB family protein [Candidatus Kaiserbacteria bacterium]|nr:peptidoglycan bridge formation glycyltransferase FemA/FemB family protein [Candidatus Kaiserbacteria bacterium]
MPTENRRDVAAVFGWGTIEMMFIHKANAEFDPVAHFATVPLYQGLLFRRWQERYGRRVVALVGDDGAGSVRVFAQCVEYVLPVVGSLWVAALGPVGSFGSDSAEVAFYKELRSLCTEIAPKTIAVRVQKEPEYDRVRMARAERLGGSFVQPFVEEVVLLEEDMEEIVRGFSGNTRKVVRRYERGELEGVRFHTEKSDFSKHFDTVYALLEQLAHRKRFAMHPRAYYRALFEELDAHSGCGTLILGYVDGEEKPVSFLLVLYTGSEAYHLCSASSIVGYDHNMPTLVCYIALRDAKKCGAKYYNLGGIASVSSQSTGDLSTFKRKFGGECIAHPYSQDIVVSGWRYAVFRLMRLRLVASVRRLVVRFYVSVQSELDKE